MALFARKQKKEKTPVAPTVSTRANAPVPASSTGTDLARVLKNPRITEKASTVQGGGVYTFDLARGASKRDVVAAIRAIYQVTPRKVAVVPVPSKVRRNARTGQEGISGGGKKAYVYLKKGETITVH